MGPLNKKVLDLDPLRLLYVAPSDFGCNLRHIEVLFGVFVFLPLEEL